MRSQAQLLVLDEASGRWEGWSERRSSSADGFIEVFVGGWLPEFTCKGFAYMDNHGHARSDFQFVASFDLSDPQSNTDMEASGDHVETTK